MLLGVFSPKQHMAVYDMHTCVFVCVCVNQRGFLNTCCWHGLCSQAPSVTGATHTHTVLHLCTYSVQQDLSASWLSYFFSHTDCVKIWTDNLKPHTQKSHLECSVLYNHSTDKKNSINNKCSVSHISWSTYWTKAQNMLPWELCWNSCA